MSLVVFLCIFLMFLLKLETLRMRHWVSIGFMLGPISCFAIKCPEPNLIKIEEIISRPPVKIYIDLEKVKVSKSKAAFDIYDLNYYLNFRLKCAQQNSRVFKLNTSPILDLDGKKNPKIEIVEQVFIIRSSLKFDSALKKNFYYVQIDIYLKANNLPMIGTKEQILEDLEKILPNRELSSKLEEKSKIFSNQAKDLMDSKYWDAEEKQINFPFKSFFRKSVQYVYTKEAETLADYAELKERLGNVIVDLAEQRLPEYEEYQFSDSKTFPDGTRFEMELKNQIFSHDARDLGLLKQDESSGNGNLPVLGFRLKSATIKKIFANNPSHTLAVTFFDYHQSLCDVYQKMPLGRHYDPGLYIKNNSLQANTCEMQLNVLPIVFEKDQWIFRTQLYQRDYFNNGLVERNQGNFLKSYFGYKLYQSPQFDLSFLLGYNPFPYIVEKDHFGQLQRELKVGQAKEYSVRIEGKISASNGLSINPFVEVSWLGAHQKLAWYQKEQLKPQLEAGFDLRFKLNDRVDFFFLWSYLIYYPNVHKNIIWGWNNILTDLPLQIPQIFPSWDFKSIGLDKPGQVHEQKINIGVRVAF